jgi:hypothetical protein
VFEVSFEEVNGLNISEREGFSVDFDVCRGWGERVEKRKTTR